MKRIIFLLLLLVTVDAYADPNPCPPDTGLPRFPEIEKLKEKISWFSATSSDFDQAKCLIRGQVLPQDIEIGIKPGAQKVSKIVRGVQFSDEDPALIQAFSELTTLRSPDGEYLRPLAKQKNIQKNYDINPVCKKVRCAVEKIWGQQGPKILFLLREYSLNSSELAFEKSVRFSDDELEDLLVATQSLPKAFKKLGTAHQPMVHLQHGVQSKLPGNVSVVADDTVSFYDEWSTFDPSMRRYTAFHEFAHNIATRLNDMDSGPDWLKVAGWKKTGVDKFISTPSHCKISNYGDSNAFEDFAETVSAYRFNPAFLENLCPEKYAFVKDKVFNGLEFTKEPECSEIPAEKLLQVKRALVSKIKDIPSITSEEIVKSCAGIFSVIPLDPNETETCIVNIQSLKQDPEQLRETFEASGVEFSSVNLQLAANVKTNDENDDNKTANALALQEKLNPILQGTTDSFDEASTESKLTGEKAYLWFKAQASCSANFFRGSASELLKCELKEIFLDDRKTQDLGYNLSLIPTYKAPSIISIKGFESFRLDREAKILNKLQDSEKFKEVMAKQIKAFNDLYKIHYEIRNTQLSVHPEWLILSPEEFCQTVYGRATSVFVSRGYKEDQIIPSIQEQCLSKQTGIPNRVPLEPDYPLKN